MSRRRERFGRVLTCRGVEAEASLSFAALSELLAPVFDDVAASCWHRAGERSRSRCYGSSPVSCLPIRTRSAWPCWIYYVIAEQEPVLVALDDLQWLDPGSAGVLQIALRRLREERVGLLATLRTGSEIAIPGEARERSLPQERAGPLTCGPLSLGALHPLLGERLGLELSQAGGLAGVQEATAGNPFFALELGRELVRTARVRHLARPLPRP